MYWKPVLQLNHGAMVIQLAALFQDEKYLTFKKEPEDIVSEGQNLTGIQFDKM